MLCFSCSGENIPRNRFMACCLSASAKYNTNWDSYTTCKAIGSARSYGQCAGFRIQQSGFESLPRPLYCVLGQDTGLSFSASRHPGKNIARLRDIQHLKMLEITLRWTSVPSREEEKNILRWLKSRDKTSRYRTESSKPQKPDIYAGLLGL